MRWTKLLNYVNSIGMGINKTKQSACYENGYYNTLNFQAIAPRDNITMSHSFSEMHYKILYKWIWSSVVACESGGGGELWAIAAGVERRGVIVLFQFEISFELCICKTNTITPLAMSQFRFSSDIIFARLQDWKIEHPNARAYSSGILIIIFNIANSDEYSAYDPTNHITQIPNSF